MPQNTNLNASPYFEDFDPQRNFYKVLFRPGYSVQARELTTLQSVLQSQLENFGRNIFKQGDLVVPGEVGLNTRLNFVKLSSVSEIAVSDSEGNISYQKYDIANLKGLKVKGVSSGVTASVVETTYSTADDSDTIFVNYLDSGSSGDEETFRQGETLEVVGGVNSPLLVVGTDGVSLPTSILITNPNTGVETAIDSPALGFASAVKVEEGIYFVNGYFVRNDQQILVINKYYDKPSAKVGFKINETISTPEEDSTLYDNARGFSNFAAPGAHRLKIELELVKYGYFSLTDKNFIQLVLVKDGSIQKLVKATDYSLIEAAIARKTFDESGDYVVEPFPIQIREFYQNNDNLGFFTKDEDDLVNGYTEDVAITKLVSSVGSGKAYIRGYEVRNKETKYLEVDKSRDTIKRNNEVLKTAGLPSVYITNVFGTIPLNAEGAELSSYPTLFLNNTYNDGGTGLNGSEPDGAPKVTISRRGLGYTPTDGIKTIYISILDANYTIAQNVLKKDGVLQTIEEDFSKIWFIKTRSSNTIGAAVVDYSYADVLSYSQVIRPEIDGNGSGAYLEVNVVGARDDLDTFLVSYDETEPSTYLRRVFLTDTEAFQNTNEFGYIADCNETITPVIGIAKPKNISLSQTSIGFNPDVDRVVSKGKLASGTESYNSIFDLSFFAPEFFTRILLESNVTSTFVTGSYIRGGISGAYAVIEGGTDGVYSSLNKLFVRMIFGEFVQGETIVSEGGDTLKIATDGNISHFRVSKRGEAYPVTGTKMVIDGVTFDRNKIDTLISGGGAIIKARVKDRSAVSTIYSQPPTIEFDTGASNIGNPAVITAVLFRNSIYTYSPENVKSVYSQFGAGNKNKFSADIELDANGYANVSEVTSNTFSGIKGYRFIDCDGFTGDASKQLVHGDIVQFADVTGHVYKYKVTYATPPSGSKRSRIVIDRALLDDVVNASVVVQRPLVTNPVGSLVIPTGDKQIKSLIDSTEDTKVSYHFRRDFIATSSSGNGSLTFAAQLPFGTQRFTDFDSENFLVTILDPGICIHGLTERSSTLDVGTQGQPGYLTTDFEVVLNSGSIVSGDIAYVNPEYVSFAQSTLSTGALTAGSVSVNFPENHFGDIGEIVNSFNTEIAYYESLSTLTQTQLDRLNLLRSSIPNITFPTLKLSATLEVSKAKPRLKTAVRNKQIIVQSGGTQLVPFRGQDLDGETINIVSYSDVFKLRYVYEGSESSPATVDAAGNLISGTDVTDKFVFDSGMRDTHYGIATLLLKSGQEAPTGQLVVSFDYFEHSQGDFCTIDSYLHEAGVGAEEIPMFNSSANGIVSLKDVIDFRPKVDNTNIITGYQNQSLLGQDNYLEFSGSGGIASSTPAPDAILPWTIKFNKTQYLDRIDGVYLNTNGEFIIKKGNPSLNPSKPEQVSDSIALYYLYVPAFTDSYRDVRIIPAENKRYTMKDIGKLSQRVERLEYYTSLSVLEQQALSMQIRDDIGLDRFKCGFFVDNFETHKGNIKSNDHLVSVDTQQSVMRAPVNEESFLVKEINTREDQREVAGYVNNNGVLTLPYQNVKLLGNDFATKVINPNPFVVLQYVGDISITPNVDTWYDRSIAPLITDNNTNLFVPFLAKDDVTTAFSQIYNSFVVTWTGTERAFFNINSLSTTNSEASGGSVEDALVASSSNISPQNNETPKGVSTKASRGKSVVTSLNYFARSIPVKFVARRLKPKTELSVFLEGKKINRWCVPDIRFTGIAGNSTSTFNSPLITDDNGNISGIILIPAGAPPTDGSYWTGDVSTVTYDGSGEDIRISTGEKTIRFTSSATNASKDSVETFAEIKFYATGLLPENPGSIVSTKPAYFKANEGIQLISNNTEQEQKPNPLAQTFKVEGYEGGCFSTGVDLFFSKKSESIPIRIYLTDVDSEKPGKNVIPGTEVVVEPYTYLQVYVTASVSIKVGERVSGNQSSASGPILKVLDKNNNQVAVSEDGQIQLTNEQVYTMVLSNHNGISFVQNEIVTLPSIVAFNNQNNAEIAMRIAKDSGFISSINVDDTGESYDSATITIESPSLPGGSNATATVAVSDGRIYNATLTLPGRGYTEPPSVVIRGTGLGNAGAALSTRIQITEPAVRMGVAIDEIGQTPSIVPTRFNFEYPVYLSNNAEYALTVETDSQDFEIWSSRLGETEIATSTTVTTNPSLGSVFKSQNVDNWTEDLFEDIKFTLYRAEFDITKSPIIDLTNVSIGYEKMMVDPIETYAFANANATSGLFKNNNNIIKVNHKNHGFESNDSYVFFKNLATTAGYTEGSLNSNLFRVSNTGVDVFNISGIGRAADSIKGGGVRGLIASNKKYERLLAQLAYIQSPGTNISTSVKTTDIVPIDSNTKNYNSYSVSDFEKTFLNEEQYFINQKVIPSDINLLMNNLDNGLVYRLVLSSSKSYLSPIIDLTASSIKTSTNRIESAVGTEERYGKRFQEIEFFPVYKVVLTGNYQTEAEGGAQLPVNTGQTVEGIGNINLGISATGAKGTIVNFNNNSNEITIKVTNNNLFEPNEQLFFSNQSQNGQTLAGRVISVAASGAQLSQPDFAFNDVINAINPSSVTEVYNTSITGTVKLWDIPNKILRVESDRQPINNDYTSSALNGAFVREQETLDQESDVFRVGDLVSFPSIGTGEERYFEIKSINYTNGVDYVPEDSVSDSSGISKYVTKELSLETPAKAVDLIITANVKDSLDIAALYKVKTTSVQKDFEELEWLFFNTDGRPDMMKNASPQNAISPQKEEQGDYQEFRYSIAGLDNFTSFGIKLVMKSDNPSYVPKIQDIRVVASI